MLSDDRQLIETPISDETVFRGALIDVSHMQVRLPNGRTALREIVHHKGAAAIVPVDDEEYVYLVRQHRVVNDMLTWEIPAGKRTPQTRIPCTAPCANCGRRPA